MSPHCFRRHTRWFLFCFAFLAVFAPRLAFSKSQPPVVATLQLLTTPTLGGQCQVIWAGVPDLTPRAATITFILESPGGAVTSSTRPLTLTRSRATDVTYNFQTPRPGVYRVFAHLTMEVHGGRYARETVLRIVVPSRGRAYTEKEPLQNAHQLAIRHRRPARLAAPHPLAAPAPSPGFTIQGVFQFTNKTFDRNGFTGTSADPIRRTYIYVYETNGGLTTTSLGYTSTADDGSFSFNVPASASADPNGRSFLLRLNAESQVVRVLDLDGLFYYHDLAIDNWLGGPLDLGATTIPVDQSGPWNILDAVMQAADKVRSIAGVTPPICTCLWALGNDDGTYYSSGMIHILGLSSDPDEFDDSVIQHEYGHFVADKFSVDKSPGGFHTWTSHISKQLAWSEGWATFYSCVVRNQPYYLDTNSYGSMTLDVEIPTDYVTGDDNEGGVAASLWDIFDSNSDGRDRLSDGISNIWYVLRRYFDYAHACIIRDFYDGWVASDRGHRPEVQDILSEHGISYPMMIVTGMTINGGAASTNSSVVTLNNTCLGTPAFYMASETADFTGAVWKPYSASPSYSLAPGNGNKGVYFKVKDVAGNESSVLTDTIILGTVPITPLAIDGPAGGGTVATEFDYNLYSFTVTTAGIYTIDSAAGLLTDSMMALYGPNNQATLIDQNDDGHGRVDYMSRLTETMQPGTYYVKMSGFAGATGSYTVWVFSGAPASTIPLLTIDGPSAGGKLDAWRGLTESWFMFDVTNPGPYTIESIEGTLYDDVMYLYGPNDKTKLIEKNDEGGFMLMAMIGRNLNPGRYYVKIVSHGNNVSGTFSVKVRSGMKPPDAPVRINNSAPVSAIIGGSRDVNWFTFQVSVPARYTIQTIAGTLQNCFLFAFGPNDRDRLFAQDVGAGVMGALTLDLKPGTYYFKVEGSTLVDFGTYGVRVFTDLNAANLAIGAGAWGSGQITDAAGTNWFQFKVTTPGAFGIETAAGTLADSVLYLYGPDDPLKLAASNDDIDAKNKMSRITAMLQPGTYYARVDGYTGTAGEALGTYKIRVFAYPMAPSAPLAINAAPARHSIAYAGKVDWYSFTVAARGYYVVEALAGTMDADYVRLFGPGNQAVLIGQGGGKAGRINNVLLDPGTYYVQVVGLNPASTGTYTIQVRTYVTPLTLDGAFASATIASGSDSDWYSFTVPCTATYTIETRGGTLGDDTLRLYTASNVLFPQAWSSAGAGNLASITRTLQAGTYKVQVQGTHPTDTGSYAIQVRTKIVGIGVGKGSASGEIALAGDSDWYYFDAASPGNYVVETTAGTLTDSYLRLYGPGSRIGTLLAQNDNGGSGKMARITIALKTAGRYYIRVTGRSASDIGKYTISVK